MVKGDFEDLHRVVLILILSSHQDVLIDAWQIGGGNSNTRFT